MSETTTKTAAAKPLAKVSSILITQSRPAEDASPYANLTGKLKVKVEHKAFIQIEGVSYKDFRKQKLNILDFSAIILTSKNAADHFFRICKEAKIELPIEMKYFCVTEQTANYLQRFIQIRKRKIFVGARSSTDLFDYFKKHPTEKYLFPCSNIRTAEIPKYFADNKMELAESEMYRTVPADLSDIADIKVFDIVAFYSPSGVESLLKNFPSYTQGTQRIATLGGSTLKAAEAAGLEVTIVPQQNSIASMAQALEEFVKKANTNK